MLMPRLICVLLAGGKLGQMLRFWLIWGRVFRADGAVFNGSSQEFYHPDYKTDFENGGRSLSVLSMVDLPLNFDRIVA